MGNINKPISMQELDSICGVIADSHDGFTVREINKFLKQCFIKELPYNEHRNKKEWLYNCFCAEFVRRHFIVGINYILSLPYLIPITTNISRDDTVGPAKQQLLVAL